MENSTSFNVQMNVGHTRPSASHPGISQCHCHDITSQQSSPRSTALPSPPDSPDSLSSLPSVSSSFFFSSSAASPHTHAGSHAHSDHLSASNAGLIIPSLTLPAALQRPSPYGQTLGEINLLVLGPQGSGKTALAEFLVEHDDVVDVGEWEDFEGGRVLYASSDWNEEHDMHGLDKFDGTKNIRVVELRGFNVCEDPQAIVSSALQQIHGSFHDVRDQTGDSPTSPLFHSLLSSSHSPLFTALVYVTASAFTPLDRSVISALCSFVPVIPYSSTSSSSVLSFNRHSDISVELANFQPRTAAAFRLGLFRSPQTLQSLRTEATDRYMRWKVTDNAVSIIGSKTGKAHVDWNKAEWESSISEDVARRVRSLRSMDEHDSLKPKTGDLEKREPCFSPVVDPLHLRSLVILSLAIFTPQRTKRKPTSRFSRAPPSKIRKWRWGFTLLGVFCAGIGIGLALSGTA